MTKVREIREFVEIRARLRPDSEFLGKLIELLGRPSGVKTGVPTGGNSRLEANAPECKPDEGEAMKQMFERLSPHAREFCCLLAAKKGEWVSTSDAKTHLKLLAMSGLTSRMSYGAKKLGLRFDQLIERQQDDQWRLFYRLTSTFAEIVDDALTKGLARRTLITSP
jgi:hypothetical protein